MNNTMEDHLINENDFINEDDFNYVPDNLPVPRILIPDLMAPDLDILTPEMVPGDIFERHRPPRNRPRQPRNHRRQLPTPHLPTLPPLPPLPPRYSNSNESNITLHAVPNEPTVLAVDKANSLSSEHSGGVTLSLVNWGGLFVRTTGPTVSGIGIQGVGGQLSANFVHHSDNKVIHQEPIILNRNGHPSRNRGGQIVGSHDDATPLSADPSILGTTVCQTLMTTIIALLFLSWCFPAAFAASISEEHLKVNFPKVEKADPIVFLPFGSIYPNSETIGIRVDIEIQPIAFMALNAINLIDQIELRDLFQEFQSHHPAAKEASSVLLARKEIVKNKVLDLVSNFETSEEWFGNPETMQANVHNHVHSTFNNILSSLKESYQEPAIVPDSIQSDTLESGVMQFSANISSENLKILKRDKRGFDFKLDVNGLWDSAIDGLLSIFHLHSNRDMTQSVNSIVAVIKNDEKQFYQYEARVNHILELMDQSEQKAAWYSSTMDLAELVLSHAESELDMVLDHLNDFQVGKLSSYVLPPKKCQEAYDSITKFAEKSGLIPVISTPSQLLQLPASTMTTYTAFVIIIHVKLVNPVDEFHAFKVMSLPFLLPNDDNVYQFNVADSVMGVQQNFQARHILANFKSFGNQCESFGKIHVCNLHVIKSKTCLFNLFENSTDLCQLSKLPAKEFYPPVRSEAKTYVFLQELTDIFIDCGFEHRKFQEIGLISIEDQQGCSVETAAFIFYTRSYTDEVQFKFAGHQSKSVSSLIVESPKDLLNEPKPESIDDLINGLIDQTPNHTSEFLDDWSPDAVGHHDLASIIMTGLSWVVIIIIVSVCLKRAFGVPLDLVPEVLGLVPEVLGLGAMPPADPE